MTSRWIVAAVALAASLSLTIVLYSADADTQDHPAPDEVRAIEIRNECSHPVWISYGPTEPLRADDATTIGGRMSTIESMLEGDNVWLLDDARRVVGRAGVAATTSQITIDDSCRRIDSDNGNP